MRIHTTVPHQDKSIGNQASLVLVITEKKNYFYNDISSSFRREKARVNESVQRKINDCGISKERGSSEDLNCW